MDNIKILLNQESLHASEGILSYDSCRPLVWCKVARSCIKSNLQVRSKNRNKKIARTDDQGRTINRSVKRESESSHELVEIPDAKIRCACSARNRIRIDLNGVLRTSNATLYTNKAREIGRQCHAVLQLLIVEWSFSHQINRRNHTSRNRAI